MRLFAAALLLALVPGLRARAETSAPAPSPHLAAAQRLYQKLDLEAALAELKEAEIAAKDNEDETAQILVYKGLIFSETGKAGEAQDMFKRALAMRPWVEIPADSSPRIAKSFADARRSLWGSGQVKPPQKRRGAIPATATQAAPGAQEPSARPAVSLQPATAADPAPAAQPAPAAEAVAVPSPAK